MDKHDTGGSRRPAKRLIAAAMLAAALTVGGSMAATSTIAERSRPAVASVGGWVDEMGLEAQDSDLT